MAWQGQLVYRAATVPLGAFHALSSLKWMALKLCPPTLPRSSTPLNLPLQLSCPCLSAHCSFGSWLRVLQGGSSALALPGWEGGREGESNALLQVRRAAGPGSAGGANCSSPDLFFGISTPLRTCSGFARDFTSICFWPGISTLSIQLGCSTTEGHHGPLWWSVSWILCFSETKLMHVLVADLQFQQRSHVGPSFHLLCPQCSVPVTPHWGERKAFPLETNCTSVGRNLFYGAQVVSVWDCHILGSSY